MRYYSKSSLSLSFLIAEPSAKRRALHIIVTHSVQRQFITASFHPLILLNRALHKTIREHFITFAYLDVYEITQHQY